MKKTTSLHNNESGLVAIVVTMILIILMSLIVMSFTRVAIREQRQVTDRQLNTLAYYAAESGVNDAREWIRSATGPVPDKENCDDIPGADSRLDGPGGSVSYSCVLINPGPTSLEYGNIGIGEPKVIPIDRRSTGNVGTLNIYWQDVDAEGNFSNCPSGPNSFPRSWPSNQCSPGMLQIDLVGGLGGSFSRDNLLNRTMTVFVRPRSGGAVNSINVNNYMGFGNQGGLVDGSCDAGAGDPKYCRINLTNIDSNVAYLKVTPLYRDASLTVRNNGNRIFGAQVLVDSTGKASDILRRIQVRIAANDQNGTYPDAAIESSESLCKQFSVAPPDLLIDGSDVATNPCRATIVVP
jgi:hypothetical protein